MISTTTAALKSRKNNRSYCASVSCLPCRQKQKRKAPAPWRGDFWYNTDTHQDRTKAGP